MYFYVVNYYIVIYFLGSIALYIRENMFCVIQKILITYIINKCQTLNCHNINEL